MAAKDKLKRKSGEGKFKSIYYKQMSEPKDENYITEILILTIR